MQDSFDQANALATQNQQAITLNTVRSWASLGSVPASPSGRLQASPLSRSLSANALQKLPKLVPDHIRREFIFHSLPHSGPSGKTNVNKVAVYFKFRGYIECAEKRSVTLDHLRLVTRYVEANCKEWRQDASTINFYHTSKWVVQPATRQNNSAFAEHLITEEFPPNWFISHWWGQPMLEFLRCIEYHSHLRDLKDVTGYWVCAYACRQHDLKGDINDDPERGSFVKAMQLAKYRTILVLNVASPSVVAAKALKRTWCAFECAMLLDQHAALVDVAACNGDQVEVIARGLTTYEKTINKYSPGRGTLTKLRREQTFPVALVEAGATFDITNTETSVAEDQAQIFNRVVGRDPNSEMLKEHSAYDDMNKRLRGVFSAMFWQWALAREKPSEEQARKAHMAFLRNLAFAIRSDEWRTSLSLSLPGTLLSDGELVGLLINSFPPNLTSLSMCLQDTGLGDASLEMIASSLPTSLRTFSIDLCRCTDITDNGMMAFAQALPQGVTKVALHLESTSVSSGVVKLTRDTLENIRIWAKSTPLERAAIISRIEKADLMKAEEKAKQKAEDRRIALESVLKLPTKRVTEEVRGKMRAQLAVLAAGDRANLGHTGIRK